MFKRMKKFLFVLVVIMTLTPLGTAEVIKLIDVPTALTLLRGYYDIEFVTYGNGGIQSKIAIGLTDRITLGISEDIGGAIGNQKADWNIPGVIAKVNILYPNPDSIGMAIGYDALLSGEYGKAYNNQMTDDVVYGAYIAFSKQVSLFTGEQHWHFGIRFPLLPFEARKGGKNISLYSGIYVIINDELSVFGEVENLYLFGGDRGKEMLFNVGVRYHFSETLSITFNFQYTSSREINSTDKPSRSLTIEYQNIFY